MPDIQFVRACLTPGMAERLERAAGPRGGEIRVHSVFRRAVNLMVGGRMLTLADEALGDLPDTLYLPAGLLRDAPGKESSLGKGGALRAGDILGSLPAGLRSPMEAYAPKPRDGSWAGRLLEACGAEKKESALERLPEPWRACVLAALEDYTRALLRGEDGAECAGRILGLGPGATPAADDALLAVSAMLRPARARFPKDLLSRTSAVSAKYLNCGQEGYYSAALSGLLEDPAPGRAHAAASCGATSGADMLYGLRAACRVLLHGG